MHEEFRIVNSQPLQLLHMKSMVTSAIQYLLNPSAVELLATTTQQPTIVEELYFLPSKGATPGCPPVTEGCADGKAHDAECDPTREGVSEQCTKPN
jgi:hypothetical protein